MHTLLEKRRQGRAAQARYLERRKASGKPSREQVLSALQAGVRSMVDEVTRLEDEAEQAVGRKLVAVLMGSAVEHLGGIDGLDQRAIKRAVVLAAARVAS